MNSYKEPQNYNQDTYSDITTIFKILFTYKEKIIDLLKKQFKKFPLISDI